MPIRALTIVSRKAPDYVKNIDILSMDAYLTQFPPHQSPTRPYKLRLFVILLWAWGLSHQKQIFRPLIRPMILLTPGTLSSGTLPQQALLEPAFLWVWPFLLTDDREQGIKTHFRMSNPFCVNLYIGAPYPNHRPTIQPQVILNTDL